MRVLVLTAMLIALFAGANCMHPLMAASPPSRTINFPSHSSLGKLGIIGARQRRVMSAQGPVTVPPNTQVELILNYATACDLSALRKLPPDAINKLVLSHLEINDSQMPDIAYLTGLESLDLGETDVTDKALPPLLKLTRLKEIDLHGTEITAAGCKTLARMSSLERVNIGSNHIGDEGISYLSPLKKMFELHAFRLGLTNQGLIPISKMTQLTHLDIQFNERVTDAGIGRLTTLKKIKVLQIGETTIGDNCISSLIKLSTLENLVYSNFQFNRLEIREMQNALPKCRFQTMNEHKGVPSNLLDFGGPGR